MATAVWCHTRRGYTGVEDMVIFGTRTASYPTPIVCCHGVGSLAQTWLASDAGTIPRALAEQGFIVLCPDLGGQAMWGTTYTTIDSALSWAASRYPINTSRIGLYATSGGAAIAHNWAAANPKRIEAIAMTIPAIDVDSLHTRDPLGFGFAASIEAVWGTGGTYTNNRITYDPNYPINARKLSYIKTRIGIWYGATDPIATPTDVESYSSNVGGIFLRKDPTNGHIVLASQIAELVPWMVDRIISDADNF